MSTSDRCTSSPVPSTVPSLINTDAEDAGRLSSLSSTHTNETTLSDFYRAVACTPPSLDDWAAYPFHEVDKPTTDTFQTDETSGPLPSQESLDIAGNLIVYDGYGRAKTFKSLCGAGDSSGRRQLVVLIRHFYCRACQAFVKTLKSIVSSCPDINTDITFIGCGHPSFINEYVARTECPFPIYTDPSLNLLRILQCSRYAGLCMGPATDYTREAGNRARIGRTSIHDAIHGWSNQCYADPPPSPRPRGMEKVWSGPSTDPTPFIKKRASIDNMRAGPIFAVGGEFLFENGRLLWCHRMKAIRGHTEPAVLRRMLCGDKRATISAMSTNLAGLSERWKTVVRGPAWNPRHFSSVSYETDIGLAR